MTNTKLYNSALEVAVEYAVSQRMTTQQICDGLILQMASVLGPAKAKNPGIDLDALLEIVRHKLDQQTMAFVHTKGPVSLRLPPPPPPKEPA